VHFSTILPPSAVLAFHSEFRKYTKKVSIALKADQGIATSFLRGKGCRYGAEFQPMGETPQGIVTRRMATCRRSYARRIVEILIVATCTAAGAANMSLQAAATSPILAPFMSTRLSKGSSTK
jgi:hypothetical protein